MSGFELRCGSGTEVRLPINIDIKRPEAMIRLADNMVFPVDAGAKTLRFYFQFKAVKFHE